LLLALASTVFTQILCGNYAAAHAQADEIIALADERSAVAWKAHGVLQRGWLRGLTVLDEQLPSGNNEPNSAWSRKKDKILGGSP
jgi:hypothetical protein